MLTYTVEVYTGPETTESGSEMFEGFIQLFGVNGDTGRRLLRVSQNNTCGSQYGQADVTELEAVFLGEVTKVMIGIDVKTSG